MRACRWRLLLLLVAMMAARPAQGQTSIQYLYDDLGRLIAVVDPGGDTAVYHYDAVGNVLSIARHVSSQVSIVSFSPGSGPIATPVTIFGTGFSATMAQDTVTFNGTTATIPSATTTQLVVTVPSGATTGTIGVTAPGGAATSASTFTVASIGAPTITSVTPSIGPAGTPVSVSGTNFDPNAPNDRVKVNATFAAVSSVTTTTLGTTIPSATASGPITIATPLGTAVSATDFIVPPLPYTTADVGYTSRLALGGSQTVTLGTANQIGLVLFAGVAGQRFSLVASSGTFGGAGGCNLHLSVLRPDTSVLVPVACMGGSGFIDATVLPVTGTYTIFLEPGTSTGSVTLAVYDASDATGTISAGGAAVTVTIATPGQSTVLAFSGTAGQRVSLLATGASFPNLTFGCEVSVRIQKPDATVLAADTCVEFGGYLDTVSLLTTGVYTVVVDPATPATGSVTLTLYNVPADASGSITPGGAAVTVTTATPGQNASLTFSGTSGHRISLLGSSSSFPNLTFGCELTLRIKNPDGSTLVGDTCMESGGYMDVTTLPANGTYTITLDPGSYATGSITLTLYDVPADLSGTVTASGASVTMTITTPGQNGAVTFSGTSGERISLVGTSATFTNLTFGCDVTLTIKKPDGSALVANACMEGGGFVDVTTLPDTGTYTITLDPGSFDTGSLTLTLYNVPADVSGTIVPGGSAVTVTTVPGQNAALTFSGTAAQVVYLQFSNMSFGGGGLYVSVLQPDTSVLMASTWVAGNTTLATLTVPTTGTYTITLDPYGAASGSVDVSLRLPPGLLVNSTSPPTVVTVSPNDTVTVAISDGPANPTDWVALAPVGSSDYSYISWNYLNGSHAAPSPGLSSATLTFTMPATTGNYEFRFFSNNSYSKLSTSTTVTVQ